MHHPWRVLVPSVALSVASLAACATGVSTEGDATSPMADGIEASAPPGIGLEAALPLDGWYLTESVYAPVEEERERVALTLVEAARAAGYTSAISLPYPGTDGLCQGKPCLGDGPAPHELALVVLEPVEGPDYTSSATTDEELSAWSTEVSDRVEQQAHDAGLPDAQVYWLDFSNLEPRSQVPFEELVKR